MNTTKTHAEKLCNQWLEPYNYVGIYKYNASCTFRMAAINMIKQGK